VSPWGVVYSDEGLQPGVHAMLIQGEKTTFETVSDAGVDDSCGGCRCLEHAPSRTMLVQDGSAQERWGSAGRV
jgi:hypothetical protein